MKKLLLTFVLILPFALFSQSSSDYVMYRNIIITPEYEKITEFRQNLAAHNKKYHSGGSSHASVWQVMSGPSFGSVIWSMGPTTWTDIDHRTGLKEHDEDWTTNVLTLTKKLEDGGFWRLMPDISYPKERGNHVKLRIRIIDVEQGENYRFEALMAKLAAAYEKGKPTQAHRVFARQGATSDGREKVVVFGYNNWQEMEDGIKGDYEEVHGEGSWQLFQEEIEDIIKKTDDELWVLMPELSGDPN